MAQMLTGKSSTRNPSRLTGLDTHVTPIWALLALGFAVALLHTTARYSLGLPGHHGIELLMALMFARLTSPLRWACLVVASGAVTGELLLAADLMHNLKHVPLYFLAAGLVDVLFRVLGGQFRRTVVAALVGGLVHMTKPVVMLSVAAVTEASFGFMRFDAVFPLVTHFSFGLVGAMLGVLAARAFLARGEPGTEHRDN